MTSEPQSNLPAGWDHLFQQGTFPPRYQTQAAPNNSVVQWADTLPAEALILDVGCGVGRHVVYLGGRGFEMAGMDVSPTGVQATEAICVEYRIQFVGRVADTREIPWPDATFDAALSTSTINHHLRADIVKSLAEIRRVLKPGGLLLVDFPAKGTLSHQRTVEQAAAGILTEIEPDTYADTSDTPDLLDDEFLPHHFSDEANVRDLLSEFEIIDISADYQRDDEGRARRGYWVAQVRK